MPMLHTSITGIRTGACRGERVVGDTIIMIPSLFSSPRSSQPTLTGGLIAGIKVEAVTVWSDDAFLLTCCDSGRRMSDFFFTPGRCFLFSRPLLWAF